MHFGIKYKLPLPAVLTLFFSCSGQHGKDNFSVSDTTLIKYHFNNIMSFAPRNYQQTEILDKTANYIKSEFEKLYPGKVHEQVFKAVNYSTDPEYKNIICSIGHENAEHLIIGAHYDVYGFLPGADDNASGVVGLLELARLFKNDSLKYKIEFVAYTLEEPPFFGTEYMGSYIHAKSLYNNNTPVKGMVCLEMIGYYNDNDNSQDYPAGFLSWLYGKKGNFITIVQTFGNGKFGRQFKRYMQEPQLLPTKSFRAPSFVPGIDFSDHRNYRKFGYSAVMVTNTAFYRNKNYHTKNDVLQNIDFKRMGFVIDEVYYAILKISQK